MKPNKNGFYGQFGGAFIPELLHNNIAELTKALHLLKNDTHFNQEFKSILKHYVGRPSPLYYSNYLSKKHNTNVYLKREDLNHTGSHKINNAIGQVLLAKRMGKTHVIAETGAGQHGLATATACALLKLKCTIFMGALDVQRQAVNVERMRMLNATVVSVTSGSQTLKDATNEAIRYWINHPETYYVIGSVVGPHPYPMMVASFQSVISAEIKAQLKQQTKQSAPDFVFASVGGGSNAAGAFYHFLNNKKVKLIGAEAGGYGVNTNYTAASLAKGRPGVLHGSLTYLLQNSDGQIQEPHSISAGLDYPGIGPLHSYLFDQGWANYFAVNDDEALQAGFELMQGEGILPAIESAHALALFNHVQPKSNQTVVVCLSGRGDKDIATYKEYATQTVLQESIMQ